jgi:FtsP/CotA-like multicopper oxidase with cupredoxin domain
VGEGPCGIAKEFGPSGPRIGSSQVLEYLDDDDTSSASSEWLGGLQKEFQGVSNPKTEYYELGVAVGEQELIKGKQTKILGYGARKAGKTVPSMPGPLLVARLGHPMVVRIINELRDYLSVHLHGSHGPAHSDGHPAFVVPRPVKDDPAHPGGYWSNHRDYFYPHTIPADLPTEANPDQRSQYLDITESPSTMWYHDHSMDVTGPHVAMGLAAFMPIYDDFELNLLRSGVLPFCGQRGTTYPKTAAGLDQTFEAAKTNPFDRPLVLQDRRFATDGQLLYSVKGHNGFLGSQVLVNGVFNGKITVAPRKYRFRILNGSNARFYKLALYAHFEEPSKPDQTRANLIPLRKEMAEPAWFRIGKDTWLYPHALRQDKVLLGMANRADVVIDFEAIQKHFDARAASDAAFKERTRGKRLVVYLANVLDQDSGRGPRGKLDDGNEQELPPVEAFQNVNVLNEDEDRAKGELREPWLLTKFVISSDGAQFSGGTSGNAFAKLGYTDLKELPRSSVDIGTPLRPHRPIRQDEIARTREVVFERGNGIWQINGKVVDEFLSNFVPELNRAECWILENGGGGWWHPIHIHLESHQQVEYLAEVELDEFKRLLAEVLLRFEQAVVDEQATGHAQAAEQLRGLVTTLRESIAAVQRKLTVNQVGVIDVRLSDLTIDANDEVSLQKITRASLKRLEDFARQRDQSLGDDQRPALELPLAAFLRLKRLYGDVPGMIRDLSSTVVIEDGRIWNRITIPPWDRFKSDTTILGPNTRVKVFMKFRTFDGPFVFHCHNLEHEDMRMMFTFDPRFTPPSVKSRGEAEQNRFHELEHRVAYRHPFRYSGDSPDFDRRPHIDSGPPNCTKTPAWDQPPPSSPDQPRAHPIWGGWDQHL